MNGLNLATILSLSSGITGGAGSVILCDDLELTLDERSDAAETALDVHTELLGSLGNDTDDIIGLITDLLHLLDDIQPEAGHTMPTAKSALALAYGDYETDRVTAR